MFLKTISPIEAHKLKAKEAWELIDTTLLSPVGRDPEKSTDKLYEIFTDRLKRANAPLCFEDFEEEVLEHNLSILYSVSNIFIEDEYAERNGLQHIVPVADIPEEDLEDIEGDLTDYLHHMYFLYGSVGWITEALFDLGAEYIYDGTTDSEGNVLRAIANSAQTTIKGLETMGVPSHQGFAHSIPFLEVYNLHYIIEKRGGWLQLESPDAV